MHLSYSIANVTLNTLVHFLACCNYVYILFFSIKFSYTRGLIHSDSYISFRFPMKSALPRNHDHLKAWLSFCNWLLGINPLLWSLRPILI